MKIDIEVNNPKHPHIQHVLLSEHASVPEGKRRRVGYCGLTWEDGFSFIAEANLSPRERKRVERLVEKQLGAANGADESADIGGERPAD